MSTNAKPAARPPSHYTSFVKGHVIVDGLHWVRSCDKCQADLAKIETVEAELGIQEDE